jgi:hypothetical protein
MSHNIQTTIKKCIDESQQEKPSQQDTAIYHSTQ